MTTALLDFSKPHVLKNDALSKSQIEGPRLLLGMPADILLGVES